VKIFTGTSNRPLAEAIAKNIGMELGMCTVSSFPDGETFVKIEENVRGEDVYLVQSTCPPTITTLMEMYSSSIDSVDAGPSASPLTAVIPFYGTCARTVKTSRGFPSRPRWWPNFSSRPGAIRSSRLELTRATDPGLLRHPGRSISIAAPVIYEYLEEEGS
jgi:ribose-phosphate pyrophosphokinase